MNITFRGLSLGDASKFVITGITGWDSIPETFNGSIPRTQRNGSWLGRLGASKKVVVVDLLILGSGDQGNTAARNALRSLYSDGTEEFELYVDMGYGNPPEVIFARVTALTMNNAQGYARKQPAQIEFTATDPRRFRVTPRVADTGEPVLAQGYAMPMSYGAAAAAMPTPTGSASFEATNEGNVPADVVYTIQGSSISVTGPDGYTLSVRFPVSGPITIDTRLGVAIAGGRDISHLSLGATIQSLHLQPGTSRVTAEGGATFTWQDASV